MSRFRVQNLNVRFLPSFFIVCFFMHCVNSYLACWSLFRPVAFAHLAFLLRLWSISGWYYIIFWRFFLILYLISAPTFNDILYMYLYISMSMELCLYIIWFIDALGFLYVSFGIFRLGKVFLVKLKKGRIYVRIIDALINLLHSILLHHSP